MFYLSRTGTTEGPFTEAVIVDMIKSRLVEDGHVCAVGASEWILLSAHPTFQPAMEERRARASGAPPAPAAEPAPASARPRASAPPLPAAARAASPKATPAGGIAVTASAVPLPPQAMQPPVAEPVGLAAMARSAVSSTPPPVVVAPNGAGPMGQAPSGSMQVAPNGMMGPGSVPPGMMPPGSMPPGMAGPAPSGSMQAAPNGMMGPGSVPPGMMPPGSMPPGMAGPAPSGSMQVAPNGMMGPGAAPPGMMPPGSMPPGMAPPGMAPPGSMGPMPAHSYGPRPSGFAGSFSLPPQEKKSNAGAIAAAVVVVVLLLGGLSAAAAYFLVFRSAPSLATYFSEGTEVYGEVASLKGALAGASKMGFIDGSKIDETKSLTDAQAALAASFELSKLDAARVALGVEGVAFGGHDLDTSSKAAMAVLISFRDAKAAELLLASPRFQAEGEAERGGKRYSLKRRELSFDQKKGLGPVESTLSGLELKTGKNDQLVWFPKQKIMALANEAGLAELVLDGKRTLAKSTSFVATKSQMNDKGLSVWIHPSAIRGEKAKAVRKYLDGTDPMVLSLAAEKAGLRMTLTGELAGLDEDMGRIDGWLDGSALSLSKKLPKETFAYVAFSSKSKLSGKDAREALMKSLRREAATAAAEKSLEEGEKALGVEVGTLFDALGDEGIIAAVAKPGVKVQLSGAPSMDDFAVVYAQKLRDQAAAKKLVGALKDKGGALLKITSKGDDLVVEGDKAIPHAELRFVDGSLVLALGAKELVGRTFAAMSGDGALGSDAAHTAALSNLKAKHMALWLDLGRIGETVLAGAPEAKAMASHAGVDLDVVRLSGQDRITGALGLTFAKNGKKLTYAVDSVNMPVVLAAAGAYGMTRSLSGGGRLSDAKFDAAPATGSLTLTPKSGSSLTLTASAKGDAKDTNAKDKDAAQAKSTASAGGDLPASCEPMLERYERCVYAKVPASHRGRVVKSLRDSIVKQDPSFRPRMCQSLMEAADRTHPTCH